MRSIDNGSSVIGSLCVCIAVYAIIKRVLTNIVPMLERLWTKTLEPALVTFFTLLLYIVAFAIGASVLWQIGKVIFHYCATHRIVEEAEWIFVNNELSDANVRFAATEKERANLALRCAELTEEMEQLKEALSKASATPTSAVNNAIKSIVEGYR